MGGGEGIGVKRIGIVTRPHTPAAIDVAQVATERLRARGIDVGADVGTADSVPGLAVMDRAALVRWADLLLVLGGDGTLLHAARSVGATGLPILAVNLGGLGFLSETDPAGLGEALDRVLEGRFRIDERMMLAVEWSRSGRSIGTFDVVNDAVVSKGAPARMVRYGVRVDEMPVGTFRADGLIVATPTGSTAYSLSAGGPIVPPDQPAILVTPICPHTLSNRPLVVGSASRVTCELVETGGEAYLNLDGQEVHGLREGDVVVASRSRATLRLVRTDGRDFFRILRTKLGWGPDERSPC